MTALEVIATAPGTSVQDLGRVGWRRFGVAVAGAMDRRALAVANALVGNPPGTAALELPLAGAEFRVADGPVLIAVAGPGATLDVAGRRIAGNRSAHAVPGDAIRVGPPRSGAFAYLAVAGGLRTEPELGSRSLHPRSGIGGRPVAAGDRLACAPGAATAPVRALDAAPAPDTGPVRVVPGPQDDHFTPAARATFLSAGYRIDPHSDRMGVRLAGPALTHAGGFNIVSDGVVPGSVQVPGDGLPIVLMRDCQTTGGYPKIATVISADLDRLAQLPPGHEVRFAAVTVEAALLAARIDARARAALAAAARPVADGADSAHLLSHNLIGGVVQGDED